MLSLILLSILTQVSYGEGDCPAGYTLIKGDIVGWGQIEGEMSVSSRQECADKCNANPHCGSFEHSNTEKLCNINAQAKPTVPQHKDYAFCSKIPVDPCLSVKGQLQEEEKKGESLKMDLEKVMKGLKEEKLKVDEATKKIGGLEGELETAKKAACPGKGIWTVPGNLVGRKISKRMIQIWNQKGLKDNIRYLGSLVGVQLTAKLVTYVECFMTV